MNSTIDANSLFIFSSPNGERYKRNFLQQAVCEFRFPTLMELGEAKPPVSFVHALRKEYPHLERASELTIGPGSQESNNAHVFRSSRGGWSVSLRQSMFAIETKNYTEYEKLKDRVTAVVAAAAKVIDSDFFTRIGLRYINVIDVGDNPLNGWINPQLVAPLQDGVFQKVNDYNGRIMMEVEDGGCLLQHGIRLNPPQKSGEHVPPGYMIDIDAFRNDISLEDVSTVLDLMHRQAFDVFDWSIGEKLRERLSAE